MNQRTWIAGSLLAFAFVFPAAAHPVTFVGTLSNAGEAPQPIPSPDTGSFTVVFDDDTFTMAVQATFSGLSGDTTASHIHCCTAAPGLGNAGVATQVPTFVNLPLGVRSGSFSQTLDMTLASSWNPAFINANGGTVASAFAALSTGINAGDAYLNIHTQFAPGGEIRGFLQAAPVPEPETWAMMLAGLGVVGAAVRRRA
jgi:hypothetical protein